MPGLFLPLHASITGKVNCPANPINQEVKIVHPKGKSPTNAAVESKGEISVHGVSPVLWHLALQMSLLDTSLPFQANKIPYSLQRKEKRTFQRKGTSPFET